jgi:Uma2 family endonuclease
MDVQTRLITVEEFEDFIALDENSDRLFELIDGEIVEKMPTEEHGIVIGNIYRPLWNFAVPRNLGRVNFEVRRRMPDDDHNARLPDVEFTRAERLLPVVSQGAVPHMPDLAVEVKSPDDSKIKMREKALYYLSNGTQLVWLVFPRTRQVEVHTAESIHTFNLGDILDCGDVLPGFTLAVAAIFEGLS